MAPPSPSEPRQLSRTMLNFWLDAALLMSVLFLVWVSALLQMVFPAPTSAKGWELWGMSFNQWRDTQFFALCVSALLALEHVVLHWNWICGVIATKVLRIQKRPDEGVQSIYGVGAFIAVLFVMMSTIFAAIVTVKHPQ